MEDIFDYVGKRVKYKKYPFTSVTGAVTANRVKIVLGSVIAVTVDKNRHISLLIDFDDFAMASVDLKDVEFVNTCQDDQDDKDLVIAQLKEEIERHVEDIKYLRRNIDQWELVWKECGSPGLIGDSMAEQTLKHVKQYLIEVLPN